ncbi:MAG: tetratricopeptide repeat protein [Cyanobacteriota bacterium]
MEPSPPDSQERLALEQAEQRLQQGDFAGAIRRLSEAVQRWPEQPELWGRLGRLLVQVGRHGEAIHCLQRAAELDPGDRACRTELGHLFRNLGEVEAAIHWHGEALALQPDSLLLHLNHLFVLPVVADSAEQIAWCRRRCEQGLRELEQQGGLRFHPDTAAACHPFYLLYQEADDRELMERYGRLIVRALQPDPPLPPEQAALPAAGSAPGPGQRLRIGFLSGFFHEHSTARAFEGLILHLDRQQFEVVLIHLASTPRDRVSERLESWCDQVVGLPAPLQAASEALAALGLQLLFFTDLGMHPFLTMLAARRSAPVQATGWGVPQTSGLPTVDYYVSGELVEPEQAEHTYVETLVRLPGLPCCYLSENLAAMAETAGAPAPLGLSRDYFLLPPDRPLWGILHRFEKLTPEFDPVLEELARAVPESLFVMVEDKLPSLTARFLERLERTAPATRERLLLLGRMQRSEFLSLGGCLDVLLDPFPFGSGITLYETIHTGTPVVTLEGRFLRSRFVAGAYRLMGVEQAPVAHSPEQYAAVAVELMRDPERRGRLRAEIAAGARAHLYDRRDYVRGFERFAREAVAAAAAAAKAS